MGKTMGNKDQRKLPENEKIPKPPSDDRERKKKHRGDNFPRSWPKPQEKNKGQKF